MQGYGLRQLFSSLLVLFDACSVASRATYEAPQQSPVGIKAIYRAGKEIPIRE